MSTAVTLTWIARPAASALHAVAVLGQGRSLVDPRLAQLLAPTAAQLSGALQEAGLAPQAFFEQAIPLSVTSENDRQLAAFAAQRTSGARPTEEIVSALAGRLAAVQTAFQQVLPTAAAQLELRATPLVELWEARGPGMLAALRRATDPALLVERADVLLVHPALGGGGAAHLRYSSVRIETVLANPHHDLPEVVRLGWLLSTLNLERPEFSGSIPRERLPALASLAMVPPALVAGEYVELCSSSGAALRQALAAWHLSPQEEPEQAAALADTLETWWQTFCAAPTSWSVALVALDQMLGEGGLRDAAAGA